MSQFNIARSLRPLIKVITGEPNDVPGHSQMMFQVTVQHIRSLIPAVKVIIGQPEKTSSQSSIQSNRSKPAVCKPIGPICCLQHYSKHDK